jgi:hypothetical protein
MLSIIFFIAFPFLFWSAWKKIRQAKESPAWPGVPGTVTASATKKAGFRKVPNITYSYRVDDRDYTGRMVSFATAFPGKETEEIVARYPVDTPVTVHYWPRKPERAVLEPGMNPNVTAALRAYVILFVMLLVVNIALVVVNHYLPKDDDSSTSSDTQPHTYDDAAVADPGLGDRLLKQGADAGDPKDEGYVGIWYLNGTDGYPKDPAQAAIWFRKAAEQGEAGSQNLLGAMYVKGTGVPKDYVQALEWFHKAAAQGEPHACVWLGMACEKGIDGTPKDPQTAIEWYRKAGDQPQALASLKRLGAD